MPIAVFPTAEGSSHWPAATKDSKTAHRRALQQLWLWVSDSFWQELTVVCTFLFIPCSISHMLLSQAAENNLASYRESCLATFPAKNSCSAVVYISEGCKMLAIWVILLSNSALNSHLKQGLERLLAALIWLGMSRDGNPTDCMVWRAGAPNIRIWEMKRWGEGSTSTLSSWHSCYWNECWHLPHLDNGSTL